MKRILQIFLSSIVFFMALLVKMGFVAFDGRTFFFSGLCIFAPVLGGMLGGVGTCFSLILMRWFKYLFLGKLGSVFMGVPTFFASLCWRIDLQKGDKIFYQIILTIFLPLLCFFVFIVHPSVQYAFWYGFYWFIPVILSVLQISGFFRQSIVVVAFKSTFVAHGVGSVFWCYMVPMSPEKWMVLIPVVAIERLVLVGGMILVYYVLHGFVESSGRCSCAYKNCYDTTTKACEV